MHTTPRTFCHVVVSLALAGAATLAAQSPAGQDQTADLLKQGQQKLREGSQAEALALFRQAVAASPKSYRANSQTGVVLDLMGQYAEARKYLARALEAADSTQTRTRALRNLAMSFAFENDCKGATPYAEQAYQIFLDERDFYNVGEVADELARVCLEAGDIDAAEKWYKTGYEQGLRQPDITPARRDLWEFRWEHAQARIAARRGNAAEAARHVAAAKAALDKGTNPEQVQFFPYLTGYVAYYTGDYKTALADLQQANQRDPFILCLIAQTYEKLGDAAQAKSYYEKALHAGNAHNPPNAYARPLARRKVG
jgi:tetratricopeptide (TPR) repeat protein